jgi:penicillin-binding protein 1A
MMRWILRGFILLLILVVLGSASLLFLFYRSVSEDAATGIQRGIIDSIIFSESPVYYDDGKSVIGVFFEKTHSKYIRYKEIPPFFIKAILAAEDRQFFSHYGLDPKAVLRAVVANFRAGRIAQGGSTITQQTAKNIFTREKRSYLAKLKELMQAILLEREYSKEEILEMYVNQFFVAGFGRGLRIASKYFFDKEAEDLDLMEAAFIAGSVKSPNKYNPFIKKTRAEKREAMRLAKLRKDYVIGGMYALRFITKDQYEEALGKEVPFREGRVTYRLNVILDYVRDQLDSEYFKRVLMDQGVENIATSGIRIYTSINKEIQEGALRSLRKHLPALDVKLTGYGGETFLEKYKDLVGDPFKRQQGDEIPFFGKVDEIRSDKENPYLLISWEGGEGVIDFEGLRPLGDAWLKGRQGAWTEFTKKNVPEFLTHFKAGDLVAIEPTGQLSSSGKPRFVLSKIPALEGGIVVLGKGMIKAMVGGFFDRFFNRAVDAKRQLGSIFKPIVYAAALELKWNPLDALQNIKDVYAFESTFYIPNPDHPPETDKVSMLWAGAKSENLATVWLLYHLTDRLNMNEFRQVVESLGLGRKATETYEEYTARIRDRFGIMVNEEDIREAAFEDSKKEVEADLIFAGHEDLMADVSRLHYKIDPGESMVEGELDGQILRRSYLRLQGMNRSMKSRLKAALQPIAGPTEVGYPEAERALTGDLTHFYVDGSRSRRIIYAESRIPGYPNLVPLSSEETTESLKGVEPEEVWIDGLIPSKVLDSIQTHAAATYERLKTIRRYDSELLYRLGDFKRLVNLQYVIRFSERIGITTKLDPVLSFPLGANSISIVEAALAYQTFMTGSKYSLDENRSATMLPVITRIEDRQGKPVWEYKPKPEKVLSDRVSGMVSDILRMVMTRGTGRGAKDSVQIVMDLEGKKVSVPLPVFGKTGTANKYTNSSFVGFIPGPEDQDGSLDIRDGYVIASYVGYDDNRPMKGRHTVIYGSSGALPLWVDTGNAIVNGQIYKKAVQAADLAFDLQPVPRYLYSGFQPVAISPNSGLPLTQQEVSGNAVRVPGDVELEGSRLILKRVFAPMGGIQDVKADN